MNEPWTDVDSLLLLQMRPLQPTRHETTAWMYDMVQKNIASELYQEATELLDQIERAFGASDRITYFQTLIAFLSED